MFAFGGPVVKRQGLFGLAQPLVAVAQGEQDAGVVAVVAAGLLQLSQGAVKRARGGVHGGPCQVGLDVAGMLFQ